MSESKPETFISFEQHMEQADAELAARPVLASTAEIEVGDVLTCPHGLCFLVTKIIDEHNFKSNTMFANDQSVEDHIDCAKKMWRPIKKGPKRIQRKRTKGWRMPSNTIYVGRPSRWGNPYAVGDSQIAYWMSVDEVTPAVAVGFYEVWLKQQLENDPEYFDLDLLRGKDLSCWCDLDQPCHADVLLELANQEEEE